MNADGPPETLAGVADRVILDLSKGVMALNSSGYHVNDFQHYVMGPDRRVRPAAEKVSGAITEAPRLTGNPIIDAFLAGFAEFVAHKYGVAVPEWTEEKERFLDVEHVVGAGPRTREIMRLETAVEWARRGLFCGYVETF